VGPKYSIRGSEPINWGPTGPPSVLLSPQPARTASTSSRRPAMNTQIFSVKTVSLGDEHWSCFSFDAAAAGATPAHGRPSKRRQRRPCLIATGKRA
jgi:hypothetical protein